MTIKCPRNKDDLSIMINDGFDFYALQKIVSSGDIKKVKRNFNHSDLRKQCFACIDFMAAHLNLHEITTTNFNPSYRGFDVKVFFHEISSCILIFRCRQSSSRIETFLITPLELTHLGVYKRHEGFNMLPSSSVCEKHRLFIETMYKFYGNKAYALGYMQAIDTCGINVNSSNKNSLFSKIYSLLNSPAMLAGGNHLREKFDSDAADYLISRDVMFKNAADIFNMIINDDARSENLGLQIQMTREKTNSNFVSVVIKGSLNLRTISVNELFELGATVMGRMQLLAQTLSMSGPVNFATYTFIFKQVLTIEKVLELSKDIYTICCMSNDEVAKAASPS